MMLVILAPDMSDAGDRQAAEALVRQARMRSAPVTILAGQGYAGPTPRNARLLRHFAPALADCFAQDLARIPRGEAQATDAVVLLDARGDRRAAFASWAGRFAPLDAPLSVVASAEEDAAALMDRIARVWVARISAAALLMREREVTLDAAAIAMKAEDAAEITFDWPFRVPWQLRLRLADPPRAAALSAIRASCVGRVLAVAVVWDAGAAAIRIDGIAGNPCAPRVTLRLDGLGGDARTGITAATLRAWSAAAD